MKPVSPKDRALDMEEVRLISDLQVMHGKVMELYQCVASLRARHNDDEVLKYADTEVLTEDIARGDEIYWFYVSLAEQSGRR